MFGHILPFLLRKKYFLQMFLTFFFLILFHFFCYIQLFNTSLLFFFCFIFIHLFIFLICPVFYFCHNCLQILSFLLRFLSFKHRSSFVLFFTFIVCMSICICLLPTILWTPLKSLWNFTWFAVLYILYCLFLFWT